MKKEWNKVEQANINIATEMAVLMKKTGEQEMLMQLMGEQRTSLNQDREKVTQQQARILMEIEEQRRKTSNIKNNSAYDFEITKLKEKIKVSKERKMGQDQIYNETELKFENAVKQLVQQQQAIVGKVSSNISENSMSQSSDIQQIEKVDVTVVNASMSSFVSKQ